jgi:hypothetical protein
MDNTDSDKEAESSDNGTARQTNSEVKQRQSFNNLVDSEDSDTKIEELATVKQANNSRVRLDKEKEEDLEVFGLPPDYYSKYDEDEDDEDFYFDSDLHLDCEIEDQIGAAELLRPERLDTLEEVSEPVSNSNSLPHDGWRFSEQLSQHTSMTSTGHMASLTSQDDREEMYSLAEMEFRNSFRIQHSLTSQDMSYSSLPSSLPSIDHLERFADDKDDSEKDERNPLNIFFHGRPNIPPQMYPGKVQLG